MTNYRIQQINIGKINLEAAALDSEQLAKKWALEKNHGACVASYKMAAIQRDWKKSDDICFRWAR
jgi:hypothetical protein